MHWSCIFFCDILPYGRQQICWSWILHSVILQLSSHSFLRTLWAFWWAECGNSEIWPVKFMPFVVRHIEIAVSVLDVEERLVKRFGWRHRNDIWLWANHDACFHSLRSLQCDRERVQRKTAYSLQSTDHPSFCLDMGDWMGYWAFRGLRNLCSGWNPRFVRHKFLSLGRMVNLN